ncbi:MAG: sugar phosphate isomerase/epimerase, partial [Acidobacteria bacterium]|nr:sugar phosphate isomerase/epimerase [Acidobacteriota bacterium]
MSSFAWTSSFKESHLNLLPKVREYGFTGFEVPMFKPADLPRVSLRRSFESIGLDCTVCAILPQDINPVHKDSVVRNRAFVHLTDCVKGAAEMGAHILGGPLYAPIGYIPSHRRTEEEWKWAVDIFQQLGDRLDEYDMTLLIEPVNRSETFFLRTARDA